MAHFLKVEFIMTVGCAIPPDAIADIVKLMLARNAITEKTQRTVRVRRVGEADYEKAAR